MKDGILLQVENLNIYFSQKKEKVRVLKNVNFSLKENEILGVVGESGSGKTVCMQSIIKLITSPSIVYERGKIFFENKDLFSMKEKQLRSYRGQKIAYIFQDPMTSLNPTMKIGKQILEAINNENKNKYFVFDLLKEVGIENAEEKYYHYPHQLSGGQRQRVMIAIALASAPKVLIADEPTTALDVHIQTQIIQTIKKVAKKRKTSVIFISHDLKIVSSIADRILVMYGGEIVESGPCRSLIMHPHHPYTKLLLLSVPKINSKKETLHTIKGSPPDLSKKIKGCAFKERCPYANATCMEIGNNILNPGKDILIDHNHTTKCILHKKMTVNKKPYDKITAS